MELTELIHAYGGLSRFAKVCGTTPQNANNWKHRGVPAKVVLAHPEIFLKQVIAKPKK